MLGSYKPYRYQPSFTTDVRNYYELISDHTVISLFYQFQANSVVTDRVIIVPDGCIDMVFCCDKDKPFIKLYGMVLKGKKVTFMPNVDYFGVRFWPGQIHTLFHAPACEFADHEIILPEITNKYASIIDEITEASDFDGKKEAFLNFFIKQSANVKESPLLPQYLIKEIYKLNGFTKIEQLSEETGYSARYINKIFQDYIGVKRQILLPRSPVSARP